MYKRIDPFLYNTPSLDIHGYDRYGAVALIRNFIDNMERIENKKIKRTENGLCPEVDRNGRVYIECFCVSQKVYSPIYKSSNQESS